MALKIEANVKRDSKGKKEINFLCDEVHWFWFILLRFVFILGFRYMSINSELSVYAHMHNAWLYLLPLRLWLQTIEMCVKRKEACDISSCWGLGGNSSVNVIGTLCVCVCVRASDELQSI